MRKINKICAQTLVFLILAYRFTLSLLFGPCCCRFYPSCSLYAIEAIQHHGCFKGMLLILRRLCRCHPWHPGGIDPIP